VSAGKKVAGPSSPAKFYRENKGVLKPPRRRATVREGPPSGDRMAHNVSCANQRGDATPDDS